VKSSFVRQALLLVALAFLPALAQAVYYRGKIPWDEAALGKDEVRLEDARAWGDATLWVDARPTEQFEAAHIPGAISLNEDRWGELLPQMLAAWSPDKRTVVYCSTQSCALSREVARRLRDEAGLKDVYVLHGGWEAWLKSEKK
jgi:rhodanese-related sulfurtransferase